jgi:hypothetical protein
LNIWHEASLLPVGDVEAYCNVPVIMARLQRTVQSYGDVRLRGLDMSGMGGESYGSNDAEASSADSEGALSSHVFEIEESACVVRALSQSNFRSRLIEHYAIRRSQKSV